jgi:hypothetical protein
MKRRPSPTLILINTGMIALATAVASTALWPIYLTDWLIVVVAAGILLGSAVAVIGAVLRWRGWAVMLASIAVFLAFGVPIAVPAQALYGILPTAGGLQDLVTGVALGWKQLVTISLPIGTYQALMVPAFILVLGTVIIGLSVAVRAKHGESAVFAPIVLFLVATALGPNYPTRPLVVPMALLCVLLFWLVWFRWYRRRAAIRLLSQRSISGASPTVPIAVVDTAPATGFAGLRTVVSAGLIIAVAATGAVLTAGALPPTADRTVVRTAIAQPFDPRDYVSPLSGFRRYLQSPTADSVLFQASGVPTGGRIRIATLDTYDGVVFSVGSGAATSESGVFTRVPSSVDQSARIGAPVTLRVVVSDYADVWVPTVGAFESISFDGPRASTLRDSFYYNKVSGTAAVLGGLQAGDGYTIHAILPAQPAVSALADLTPGSATVPVAKNVPDSVAAKLDEYVGNTQGAGPRLVAMLSGLAAQGYISHGISATEPASRSGHAADRITELLTAPRMIGDAEQYAVTAALMAQKLGFPARVVFGFAPKTDRVTGGDIAAWIEVSTAQYGWVTIDPVPPVRDVPAAIPQDQSQVARPQTVVPPLVQESDSTDRQPTPDSERPAPSSADPLLRAVLAVLRVGAWMLVGIAILLAPFIVILAAKVRRRRLRMRAPTTIDRISGGWQEFKDAVLDHGLSPNSSSTRSEVATIAGGMQSQVLAAVVDRAIFSPDEPASIDAERVWRAVDELQDSLDEGLTRWQRIRARVSLRSLGGYSVRALFSR